MLPRRKNENTYQDNIVIRERNYRGRFAEFDQLKNQAQEHKMHIVAVRFPFQQQSFLAFIQGGLLNSSVWALPGGQQCSELLCELQRPGRSASQRRMLLLLVSVPDSKSLYSDQECLPLTISCHNNTNRNCNNVSASSPLPLLKRNRCFVER